MYNDIDLLPQNSSGLERALSEVEARLDALDMDLPAKVKNPWLAPEWALPYLAWEASVDVWNNQWGVEAKRRAIANAAEIHRIKGTVKAVKLALQSVGVEPELSEWWQNTPKGTPFTFNVTAWVSEDYNPSLPLLNPERLEEIRSAINAAKPISRGYDLKIGVRISMKYIAVMAATLTQTIEFTASNGLPDTLHASVGVSVAATLTQTINFYGEISV